MVVKIVKCSRISKKMIIDIFPGLPLPWPCGRRGKPARSNGIARLMSRFKEILVDPPSSFANAD